jgi:hypothetical protein
MATVAVALAIAGCGGTHASAGGPSSGVVSIGTPGPAHAPSGAPGPTLARAEAHALLEAVVVHGGTVTVPARAGGSHGAAANAIDVHETWRIAASPNAVTTAIRDSHPSGLKVAVNTGSVIEQGVPYISAATFSAGPTAGLQSEALALSITDAPNDSTLLRADAQVAWLGVRPPAQQLPAGIKRIGVIRAEFEPGVLHWAIRDPAEISEIVKAMESLPSVPANAGCPLAATSHRSEVTLKFRGANGKVLAEAGQPSGPEVGACNPMYFSVGQQEEPSLAHGARVIELVGRIVGRNLVTGE